MNIKFTNSENIRGGGGHSLTSLTTMGFFPVGGDLL